MPQYQMNAPSFSTQEYWQDRFIKNKRPFDWLLPAESNVLDSAIQSCISSCREFHPQILHIGCGTSELSLHLRHFVSIPRQIHNSDFSSAAIAIAEAWEQREVLGDDDAEDEDREETAEDNAERFMRWSVLDLLSSSSVGRLLNQQQDKKQYHVIIDKSTSDAIACGGFINVNLPYSFRQPGLSTKSTAGLDSASIHPLHILAVHLAALTAPGGRWLTISYSADRFPFLPPLRTSIADGLLEAKVIVAGFPDSKRLWTLERKEQIEIPEADADMMDRGNFHRPKIANWLYILVRTQEPVVFR